MIYDLAGFVSLSAESEASAFLIPFFRSRTSNLVFAQDLDNERNITRFLAFDPQHYTIVEAQVPAISRVVGDPGVMAFVRRGDVVFAGDHQAVVDKLSSSALSGDRSPFFEIDAYGLTDQPERLRSAVKRARRALGDGPIAARWAATETALLRKPKARVDSNAEPWQSEMAALASDFGRKDWPKRWAGLWSNVGLRDRLRPIGLDYVEKGQQPVTMSGRVLSTLLRGRRGYIEPRLLQIADDWLVDCARVQPTFPTWPVIWRAVAAAEDHLSGDMVKRAIVFLRESAAIGKVSSEWARVSAVLRQKRPDDEHLADEVFGLARDFLLGGRVSAPSLKPVVKMLIADHHRLRSTRAMEEWVKSDINFSNAWIDAFLAVLDVRGGDHELLNIGLDWLEQDPGTLRRWNQVYAALDEQVGPSPGLHDAARGWVLRANRRMHTWPEVVLDVLSRGADRNVETLLGLWLSENREHPLAARAEAALMSDVPTT